MSIQRLDRSAIVRPDSTAPSSPPPATPHHLPADTSRLPLRDRFVQGAWAGGLAGIQSTMLGAVPIVLLESKTAQAWLGNVGPGTSAKSIAVLTLAATGTGALAGGLAAVTTRDQTWGTAAGAVTGGLVVGATRGLMSRSWQGAAIGAVVGGLVGGYAGRLGARSAMAAEARAMTGAE